MKSLVIIAELRKPHPDVKDEHGLFGLCETQSRILSRIFIDSTRKPHTRADTFFHEITHAWLHWRGRIHGRRAEYVSQKVGQAAAKALRQALKHGGQGE